MSFQTALTLPLERLAEYHTLFQGLATLTPPNDQKAFESVSSVARMFANLTSEVAASGYSSSGASAVAAHFAVVTVAPPVFSPGKQSLPGSSSPGTAAAELGRSTQHDTWSSSHSQSLPLPALPAGGSIGVLQAAAPFSTTNVPAGKPLTTDDVLVAQAEADEAARRLEVLEREVNLRERELGILSSEVVAEAQKGKLGAGSGPGWNSSDSPSTVDAVVQKLAAEEKELLARITSSEHRGLFESYLARKRELEEEEAKLTAAIEEHEEALVRISCVYTCMHAAVTPVQC